MPIILQITPNKLWRNFSLRKKTFELLNQNPAPLSYESKTEPLVFVYVIRIGVMLLRCYLVSITRMFVFHFSWNQYNHESTFAFLCSHCGIWGDAGWTGIDAISMLQSQITSCVYFSIGWIESIFFRSFGIISIWVYENFFCFRVSSGIPRDSNIHTIEIEHVNMFYSNLIKTILLAAEHSIPKIKSKKISKHTGKAWWSKDCKQAVSLKKEPFKK